MTTPVAVHPARVVHRGAALLGLAAVTTCVGLGIAAPAGAAPTPVTTPTLSAAPVPAPASAAPSRSAAPAAPTPDPSGGRIAVPAGRADVRDATRTSPADGGVDGGAVAAIVLAGTGALLVAGGTVLVVARRRS